ncbi:STAS domain-containing protein [Desulfovibrio inopinatus]|uniref:STAS domain-containing protein n=1 Tax=Desulfovibrio inopinatus TaxID=102109 RepID=UPI0003FCD2D4|nr:STAS domain-containing protein [Desulfovibrio inopinatus]
MTQRSEGEKSVFIPDFDIIASHVDALRKCIEELLVQDDSSLTIDMVHVTSIDSIGIGLLVATHNTLKKNDGNLALKNVSSDIMRLFNIMRLDRHFTM